jgi:hypothetical protein
MDVTQIEVCHVTNVTHLCYICYTLILPHPARIGSKLPQNGSPQALHGLAGHPNVPQYGSFQIRQHCSSLYLYAPKTACDNVKTSHEPPCWPSQASHAPTDPPYDPA